MFDRNQGKGVMFHIGVRKNKSRDEAKGWRNRVNKQHMRICKGNRAGDDFGNNAWKEIIVTLEEIAAKNKFLRESR